ncbi:unnamed protein product [Urochloa humidicola]
MPQFVLKERNKIADNYFHPLSKQLLHDLETYGIVSTSTSQITTDIIEAFGYVKALDMILKKTSKALHAKCNCYVSDIIIGEDDVTNANMIAKVAKVLVPEFKEEIVVPQFKEDIGLPEIAGGFGSKPMFLPKDAVKAIAGCDKQEILKFLEMLSKICKEKKRAFQKLREIEAQIGVARIAVSDEAVDKDDQGKTQTKGSNKDRGFVKKCEPTENDQSTNNERQNQWRMVDLQIRARQKQWRMVDLQKRARQKQWRIVDLQKWARQKQWRTVDLQIGAR